MHLRSLPRPVVLACTLAAAVALAPSRAAADPPRGYGSLDVGGSLGLTDGSDRWFLGLAGEAGLSLNDLLQFGARLRFFPGGCDFDSCHVDWGLDQSTASAAAIARLRFEPVDSLMLGVGLSVGWAFLGDCYSSGSDTCEASGLAVAVDLRIAWMVQTHLGLHLSFEPQIVFDVDHDDRLFIPAAWLGVDW